MTELISLKKIAQWQKLKTLVLDSVSSPITKRRVQHGTGRKYNTGPPKESVILALCACCPADRNYMKAW
jgi:hypothetical protein